MKHYWNQWLSGGRGRTLAWVVLLAIILGLYIGLLLPHLDTICEVSGGVAENGEYLTNTQHIGDYWHAPHEFGTVGDWGNSTLGFLFHITPNNFGYNPLFAAFLGYTSFIFDSIHPIERPDMFLNMSLLVVNCILIFLILKKGVDSRSALVGSLFYGFSVIPLIVGVRGYPSILGMTFILLAAYMLVTIDYTNLQRRRLLLAGLFLSCALFTSNHAIAASIGLALLLVVRLILTSARKYQVLPLLRKVSFLALGFVLPFLYYGARDIWLYYNNYPVGDQHGPYVFRDALMVFGGSSRSIEDFLPRFYFDYLYVLGGPILLALFVILSIFCLYRLVSLVQDMRARRASWLDPGNQSQILFVALAIGGATFLLMTLLRLSAIGRAYSAMTIYEALLFGLFISQIQGVRFRTKAFSYSVVFVLALLLMSIPLLAVNGYVKSADAYTHHGEANYSDIPHWDANASFRREGEFSLASFLRYLRDETDETQNDYFILREPALYFRVMFFGAVSEMLPYLAYLVEKEGVEPVASLNRAPAVRYFNREGAYYNIYLGNAAKTFPELPWLRVIPPTNETIFRTSDIRKAYAKTGYLVVWDNGELTSRVGWRQLINPNNAVTTSFHPGQVIAKAWEFNGNGGLSLTYGATTDYKHEIEQQHGIDISGELSLGFWIKLPLIESSTSYPILTFGGAEGISVAICDSKVVVSHGETTIGTSSLPIEKDTWTFVVVTKSRSGVKIWVNGEPAGIFPPIMKPLAQYGLAIGYDLLGRFPPLPAGTEIAQLFYSDCILSELSDGDVNQMYMSSIDMLPALLSTEIGPRLKAASPPEIHAIWHMDETDGAELTDATGVYRATSFNTEVIAGPLGEARHFNGHNSCIKTTLDLRGSSDVTISFWVRVDADQTTSDYVAILDNEHTATENFVVQSTDKTAKTFAWHCFGANALFDLPHDRWTHVLLIANSNKKKLEVYVDGEKSAESEWVNERSFGSTPLALGKPALMDARYFKGDIDEVQIWNRALTEEEFPAEIRPIPYIDLTSYIKVPLEGSFIELSNFGDPGQTQSLVDGNPDTFWHVEYPPQTDEHWVLIDLGTPDAIDALSVEARRGVVSQFWDGAKATLQGSNDKETWTSLGALTVDKSTLNNEEPQWVSFSIKSRAAFRYYRIFIKDSSFLSLAELEIYRSPGEVPPVEVPPKTYQGLIQVTLESSSIEVSSFNNPDWENKESLVDGNLETFWHVKWPPQTDEHWALIDLGTPGSIDMLRVKARRGYPSHFRDGANAVFQGSNDKETWTSLGALTVDKSTLNNEDPQWLDFSIESGEGFRYYRILIKDSSFLSLAELEIYRGPSLPMGL